MALRQLVMSTLAKEDSVLHGLPPCDDIDAMLDCLKQLQVSMSGDLESGLCIEGFFNRSEDLDLNARQSGVSLRLLLALSALRHGITIFHGEPSLANRPNAPLLSALEQIGCRIESIDGKLPIRISGPSKTHATSLDASTSSQFLSALLVIAPSLPNGLQVRLKSELASAAYARGTIDEISKRGIAIEVSQDERVFSINPQSYQGGEISIEGDASASTYHMALATLHGATVHIDNVGTDSWQPDYAFAKVCELLGASVQRAATRTTITGPRILQKLEQINMAAMPDAAPTLMAMAPYLPTPITISGLATLRHKECDRIACPAKELTRAGIRVQEDDDKLTIWPGNPIATEFETYDDHRMAMAFAVLATKTRGCRIRDPSCVNKTYTNFWRDMGSAYVN